MSKQVQSDNILVIKGEIPNVVDVFVGKGWERWTRFQVVKGHPKMLAGQPLTSEDYDELRRVVKAW